MSATIPALQKGRYSIEQESPYFENFCLFQAYDTEDETPVTIVEVPLRLPKIATATQRDTIGASLAKQANILVGFRHASIVAVQDYFTEAGRNYLVTDRVDGVDLASVLAGQKQPFTVTELAGWADTVLDVLNAMHNSRPAMVYRNLRPENIVLRADGSVNLIASGMLCSADAGGSPLSYSPLEQIWSGLDAASQKVIINNYDEASERVLKQDLDAKSDLYSLGATLYHLITGQVPVDALERSIEMIEGNADPLKSPNTIDATVPVEVSDVIMKAMEIRREYRFDSAAIMRQVLKTALVRVKEREAEEALVQTVEQHDVRPAVQNTPPAPAAKKAEDDAAAAQKVREIEENRLEAERRAQEAEKKIQQAAPKARPTETFDLAELEDDVLGILSPSTHTSEPPQVKTVPAVTQIVVEQPTEKAAEVPVAESKPAEKLIPQVEEKQEEAKPAEVIVEKEEILAQNPEPDQAEPFGLETEANSAEPEVLGPGPVEEEPETTQPPAKAVAAAVSFNASSTDDVFTERKSGSGIGLPAIVAAAVVLCVVAIAGWSFLGSDSSTSTPDTPAASQPAEPVQQDAPAKTAVQPTTDTTSAPVSEQPTVEQPGVDQQNPQSQKVASSAPPKAKKPAQAPTKTPAQKKAVTVDDLINDN